MIEWPSYPNPLLTVQNGNRPAWNQPDQRRASFHRLDRIARYGMNFSAAQIAALTKSVDLTIADNAAVREFVQHPFFSGMIVIRGNEILFESYARDCDRGTRHSIQSITKTFMHLIYGRIVGRGEIVLERPISDYLPEIGSGYATASVQQVLDMNVRNDYSEDMADVTASYFVHEEAMGWRLPKKGRPELTIRAFLPSISSDDTRNPTGTVQYKDANTAVLGLLAERVTGLSLRSMLASIVDAAGLEDGFFITSDRDGFPCLDGGGVMSLRDLARYGRLLSRGGCGLLGLCVGDGNFTTQSKNRGVPYEPPRQHLRYSNHLVTDGTTIGHGGYGGQYMITNPETETVAAFSSVLENPVGFDLSYQSRVATMLTGLVR